MTGRPSGAGRAFLAIRRILLALLVVVTLVSFAPVASVVAAGAFASLFDCAIDEGSVHPCVVAGVDWGHTLYTADVLGWLMFVTAPGILLSLVAWSWVIGRWLFRRRRARRR